MGACLVVMGKSGDLDLNFDPELRAWVTPDHVTVAADGRTWIGGGFDRGDGYSTGDLVRLGVNGGVESEPAAGYLNRVSPYILINGLTVFKVNSRPPEPFLLESGGFLVRGESGGWLRISAAGVALGKAFQDRIPGEDIIPQFERAGGLWVIRQRGNGERILERRSSVDGTVDPGFSGASVLPRDVNAAVPAPNGGAWLLAGDVSYPNFYFGFGAPIPKQRIFQLDVNGNPVGLPRVIAVSRDLGLVAGPDGKFRLTYGPDQSSWYYWPSPSSTSYRIEWYSAAGELERAKDFYLSLYNTFTWAESAEGTLVATDGTTKIAGSSQFFVAKTPS